MSDLPELAGPSQKPLRVLLVEDDEIDAELITLALRRTGLTVMMGRVDSAPGFRTALQSLEPDVVLCDHSMARFDSRAVLETLRATRPTVPMILVTGELSGAQSVAMVRAGVDDIVLKRYLTRLPMAIRQALAARRKLHSLTGRQIEVLRLVTLGYRTRDIAKALAVSVKTIESHRGDIMKRLDLHDVVSVVRYAVKVGLVPVDA